MINRVDTGIKLNELVHQLEGVSALIGQRANESTPWFVVVNLLNGDIKTFSKIEAIYDVSCDPCYLVIVANKKLDINDKFLILDRILQLNFCMEAVEIVRARATFNRRSESGQVYVSYDMELGYIDLIEEEEYKELVSGTTYDEQERIVVLPLSGKAMDNLEMISRNVPSISKQISYKLQNA